MILSAGNLQFAHAANFGARKPKSAVVLCQRFQVFPYSSVHLLYVRGKHDRSESIFFQKDHYIIVA